MFRSKKKLIGLFGGSFDPPHKGHLKISKASIKKLKLDRLFWIVTKKNPFKKDPFFSLKNGIDKSKKIIKKNKIIKIRFLDKLVGSNRTIDTLKFLIKKNKNSNFFLIIGSDSLINFHKWKSWKKILKMCQLVVFPRKGFDKMAKKTIKLKEFRDREIIYIKNEKIDISSSKIRKNYLR